MTFYNITDTGKTFGPYRAGLRRLRVTKGAVTKANLSLLFGDHIYLSGKKFFRSLR
jgi:hypothetical protein